MVYELKNTGLQQNDINSLPVNVLQQEETILPPAGIIDQSNNFGSDGMNENTVQATDINQLPQIHSLFSQEKTTITQIQKPEFTEISVDAGNNSVFSFNQKIFASNDWMVGVLITSFLIVIFTKLFYSEYFTKIVSAIFDSKSSTELFVKRNSQRYRISFLITFVFALNLALFSVQLINHFPSIQSPLPDFATFLFMFFSIMFTYMSKKIVINSLGTVLKKQKAFYEYLHNTSLYNKAIGLVLFPFILSIPFIVKSLNKPMVILAVVTIVVLYLFRFVKGIQIILQKKTSVLYSVLYICTLEIAPVLIMFRALKELSSSGLVAQLLSML